MDNADDFEFEDLARFLCLDSQQEHARRGNE